MDVNMQSKGVGSASDTHRAGEKDEEMRKKKETKKRKTKQNKTKQNNKRGKKQASAREQVAVI
jgi:hypothetical protein